MTLSGSTIPARKSILNPLSDINLNTPKTMDALYPESEPLRIMPDVNVIKIGGQSVIDRGRDALIPLREEIGNVAKRHRLLIGAGGGTRARHAYSLALDLDLPTGVLATIGQSTAVQNARILQLLLAEFGGIFITPEHFQTLPLFFKMGCIPIMTGMPPYEYWEKPPAEGRIPPNRTDSGVYLTAECLGARQVILVKDENGLYTDDPKKNRDAKFIPRISVQELLERRLQDLIVEPIVLHNMLRAVNVREIQIINGMVPGNLTRALDGEPVGTTIYVDDAN
jgi:molybdenum storage protein